MKHDGSTKKRLHKGGKCSEKDFDLLMQKLPYDEEFNLNPDDYVPEGEALLIGYRTSYWFYIHEVRGYCVIYMPYALYETELSLPGLKEKYQYLIFRAVPPALRPAGRPERPP